MKHIYLFLFIPAFFNSITNAQDIEILKHELDSLLIRKTLFESEIEYLNKEIERKSKLLNDINEDYSDVSLWITIISKEIKILDSKSIADGKIVTTVSKNEKILLLDYDQDFYFVKYKNTTGYIYYIFLKDYPKIEDFKTNCTNRKAAQENKEKAERSKIKLDRLIGKYGADNALKILRNEVWIGMNKSMAIESIGQPQKINNSTFDWGTHEQWIYPNDRYLYFENDTLKSLQYEK